MIYFIYSDMYANYAKWPKYVAYDQPNVAEMPLIWIQAADYIFEFKDGKTVYIKDRTYKDYQYTDEERLVLILRSVLH